VQSIGPCCVIYLGKQNPGGTTTKVDVPDVMGGTIEVGRRQRRFSAPAR
jgi:hypothetical protein